LQYLVPTQVGPSFRALAPHNSDARQPQDTSRWPSALIVDLVYAAAALQAWGPKGFTSYVRENAKGFYYDNDVEGSDGVDDDTPEDGPRGPNTQIPDQPTARSARYARRSANKAQAAHLEEQLPFSDMLDVVMALWMRSAREVQRGRPSTDTADVARNQEDVQMWLQSLE
jgi:hypothetical protein